jgi:hypothetical protein
MTLKTVTAEGDEVGRPLALMALEPFQEQSPADMSLEAGEIRRIWVWPGEFAMRM